jgi:uncharacterized protein with FMN-binding domain
LTPLSKRIRVTTMGLLVPLVMAPCWATGTAGVRPTPASAAEVSRSGSATRSNSTYADGVYAATGQYGSLPSSITVTVTLVDDVIAAVEVTPHATDATPLDLQRRFAAAVPAVVVGERIDEVHVDRLAGSSGTPQGFNAAIERIKELARSSQATSNVTKAVALKTD